MAHAVAGLDLSLAGTAAVVIGSDGRPSALLAFSSVARDFARAPAGVELHRATSVPRGDAVADYERTASVADAVRVFLRRHLHTGAVVGIEDHAFGAKGAAVYQLGHLHGVVRRDVVGLGCRFLLVNVTEAKRSATGRGDAGKADVVKAAAQSLELEGLSRGVQEGLADAYAVARLTWCVDRVRRGLTTPSSLPGDVARVLSTPRGAGLLERRLIG